MVENDRGQPAGRRAETLIRPAAPIVPSGSIAGRSLMAVVAIMTFLVALTAGGVLLIAGAAADWGSQISREVTIQVRPVEGRDVEAEIAKAVVAARATEGISDVQVYSREETERMLVPWLGEGLDMGDLPIPRLIVVKITPGSLPDFATLKKTLAETVAGASLDAADADGKTPLDYAMGRYRLGFLENQPAPQLQRLAHLGNASVLQLLATDHVHRRRRLRCGALLGTRTDHLHALQLGDLLRIWRRRIGLRRFIAADPYTQRIERDENR